MAVDQNYATLTNAELRRLEADRDTPAEVWRAVVAEIANREASARTPAATYAPPAHANAPRVVISAIDIPFWNMVRLLVQIAIAAIPAVLIVAFVVAFAFAVAGGIGAGFAHR